MTANGHNAPAHFVQNLGKGLSGSHDPLYRKANPNDGICYECERNGEPSQHEFWNCAKYLASKSVGKGSNRGKGQKGGKGGDRPSGGPNTSPYGA